MIRSTPSVGTIRCETTMKTNLLLVLLLLALASCSKEHATTGPATPSPTPTTTPTPAPRALETVKPADTVPYAIAVPGRPGFVYSPYDKDKGYIDVRGFPPGTEVKDPYSTKSFLVP